MGEEGKPASRAAAQRETEATSAGVEGAERTEGIRSPFPTGNGTLVEAVESPFPTGNGTYRRRPEDWGEASPMPPTPPTSVGEVVFGSVALVGLTAFDVATGGILSTALSLPAIGSSSGDEGDGPEVVVPLDLHLTAAPARDAAGLVACSRCQKRVPYASMSLNEHGYFCRTCGPSQPL